MALHLDTAYKTLLGLSIDLNFNDAPNPSYIQTKLIECHEASRKVEKIHTQLKMDMSRSMRLLSLEEGKFEVLQREALSQNETVKRFPSYQDRLAYVGTLLESNIESIRKLKSEAEEQKNLEKALNLIIKNLSRLNSDVKAQQKLMESQINKLGMGDVGDKDVKDLMSKLGTLSAELDADGLKVGEAEEDDTTEDEKEESVDLSALEESIPVVKEETSPKVIEKTTTKTKEIPSKVDEDPLAGLLDSVSDKKKRDSKDTPPLKEEDTQVNVDLSASFLEDDIEDLNTSEDSEESDSATNEEPEYTPAPLELKMDTDDLEDALAGLSEEIAKKTEPKKETPKKDNSKTKTKKEEKPKVKDEASEGEINIDELLLGIT